MKIKIAALVLAVVMVLLPGGCGGDNDTLLGKWTTTIEGITFTREFKDDGTIIEKVSGMQVRTEGTYTVEDDRIIIAMTHIVNEERGINVPIEVDWEFSYSIRADKLILIDLNLGDGEEVTYTRE